MCWTLQKTPCAIAATVAVAAVVTVFSLFSVSSAFALSAVPVSPVEDVGVVSKGKKIEHRFEIRNEGTRTLRITEVKPDCGCAVVEFDKTIAAGKSGGVVVTVDTKDFRGPIAKSVEVFTDDPENPRIQLVVKADVRPRVEVEPVYARFLTVVGEKREPSVHLIWSADGSPLEVTGVKSPFGFLKASVRKAEPSERKAEGPDVQWLLTLELDQDTPIGPLADFVELTTTHARQKLVRLPVSGFVRPVLAVTPGVADFGPRELVEPYKATLEIRNLGSDAVAVTEVATDVRGVQTAIEEVEEGKRFLVRITLDPEMAKGPFRGTLRISTSSKRQPLVEVDLSGTIL